MLPKSDERLTKRPDFSVRSNESEIMDNFTLRNEALFQTLRELDFINKWLGGNAITLKGFRQLFGRQKPTSLTIADWGCGSGDMLIRLHKWAIQQHIQPQLYGIDANQAVIDFAQKHTLQYPEIRYLCAKVEDTTRQPFDVITATLFTHHFPDEELVKLFRQMKEQVRIGIVINDLHRHPLAYHSIRYLTKWFSKSYMTQYDAKLSVLKGFSREELENLLVRAGWENIEISWQWAFRWLVVARK